MKKNLWFINNHPPTQATLVELGRLRAHEQVDLQRLNQLKREIESDRILKFAIAVDEATNIILDGNHRFHALRRLGCRRIPVVFVDLNTPQIKVGSWRDDWEITKEMVIEAGLGDRKLPPKTSKHMIVINGRLEHIFAIEKKVDLRLRELRMHA